MRAFATAILALLAGGQAVSAADNVADLVFGQALMGAIQAPVLLDYAYALEGEGVAQSGPVHVDVRTVEPNGRKSVWFDMEAGDGHRAFGPVEAMDQNPLVILFLQRDAVAMERATGGSQNYFRNRLREAFNAPATVEAIEVTVGDRKLPATRVTIRPFAADARIERFPGYRDKAYEFVVAPDLPGGVYRLATILPADAPSKAPLRESITFEKASTP